MDQNLTTTKKQNTNTKERAMIRGKVDIPGLKTER